MQADPNDTGLALQTWACFRGHALDLGLITVRPGVRYHDGLNAYEYVRSNPANALDPQGLLTLFGLLYGVSEGAYVEMSEAQRTNAAAAAILIALGALAADNTWGVLGGMSAFDFDVFVQATDAWISGAFQKAELLYAVVETIPALWAASQDFSGMTVAAIIAAYKKGSIQNAPLPPGGPDWKEILRMTWEEIVDAAKQGKRWARTVKKLLTDQRFRS